MLWGLGRCVQYEQPPSSLSTLPVGASHVSAHCHVTCGGLPGPQVADLITWNVSGGAAHFERRFKGVCVVQLQCALLLCRENSVTLAEPLLPLGSLSKDNTRFQSHPTNPQPTCSMNEKSSLVAISRWDLGLLVTAERSSRAAYSKS